MTHQKKHNNIIQINGIQYNATTGLPLVAARAPAPAAPIVDVARPVVKTMDVARPAPRQHKAHALQPGKTLMRSGLQKPSTSLKRTTKINVVASAVHKQMPMPLTKSSVSKINPNRAERAAKISISPTVQRFGAQVVSAPATLPEAAPNKIHVGATTVSHVARLDMFERAIAQARTHEQPAPKIKSAKSIRSRRRSLASGAMAMTLLVGFIAYQNVTNIKLQVASSRAGFQAELPSKRPSGFSVAGLSYQPGSVDVKFKSNSDQRTFALTQKASNWDSQALREVYVSRAAGESDYQAVDAGGRMVYLYGKHATWVNGGVWYQVTTDGSLSSRQLLELASSI